MLAGVQFLAVIVWATLVESTPPTAVPTAVHLQHGARRKVFSMALRSPGRPLRPRAQPAQHLAAMALDMLMAVS